MSYPQDIHRLYIIHRSASFMPELSTGYQSYIRVKLWITTTSSVDNYFEGDSSLKGQNASKRV
jgi:hypothetical protein